MSNGSFNSWIYKKDIVMQNQVFSRTAHPSHSKNEIEVELYLANYATISALKNAAGVDPSGFAKKDDLASLKSDIDKSNIDNLQKVRSSLISLKCRLDK